MRRSAAQLAKLKGWRYSTVLKLAPFPKPSSSSLDFFKRQGPISAIKIEKIDTPKQNPEEILSFPHHDKFSLLNEKPQVEYPDLFFLSIIGIEAFSLTIGRPQRDGKNYDQVKSQQLLLDNNIQNERRPIADQSPKTVKRQNRPQPYATHVDVFDLIFPLLQPSIIWGPQFSPILVESLKAWQPAGIQFLLERESALLGDEMGLGKTVQTIVALKILFQNAKLSSGLILCPKSLLGVWDRELDKWANELQVVVVDGAPLERQAMWNTRAHLHIASYDSFRKDVGSASERSYGICILDEIQRIKNEGTQTAVACQQIKAHYKWGLSGTPVENKLTDIQSIFSFIKPDLLNESDGERSVQKKIAPYFLRRRAEDCEGMPEVQQDESYLDLLPKQREKYDQLEKRGIIALTALGEKVTTANVLHWITELKKVCNIDLESGESIKLEYLKVQLENIIQEGNKALVFSQYPNHTLKNIVSKLSVYNPEIFDGALSSSERDRIVKEFQMHDKNKILLMSVRAGGLGLTLTKANYVFHFDHWWNPAVSSQASGRVARIGQTKTVFVRNLIIKNSIEERIQALLHTKRELFNRVIDDLSDEGLESRLTEKELLGLFGLTKKSKSHVSVKLEELSLSELRWEEFEDLIGKLYEAMGYKVKVTNRTGDHGVDIIATSIARGEHLVIQCKHTDNPVSEDKARDLWGAVNHDHRITQGVLVTSGTFSQQCRRFVEGKRIQLIEKIRLEQLLSAYGIM